jgi:hypothetical protein
MSQAIYEQVRDTYAKLAEQKSDPRLIACTIGEAVGLCDKHGQGFRREGDDAPCLAPKEKRTHRPGDFKFDVLAEAIIGRDWKTILGLGRSGDAFGFMPMIREASRLGRVQEESAAPSGPSPWANVAAWSATVGGLMGAQFNLGYETSEFELADLPPVRPAVFWQGGERYIDILGPSDPAQATGPGEEYPDNNMTAFWVEPGPQVKYAGKIALTKEMLAIDISGGQMLSKANNGGWTLKFRENELAMDAIVGSTNNFKLGFLADTGATAYNTYGPTITGPKGTARVIPNDIVNPWTDPGTMQRSDEQLANLFHPATDNPIKVEMGVALYPTPLAEWAEALNDAAAWDVLSQTMGFSGPAQQPPGDFPTARTPSRNPWKNRVRGIASRWLHQRHTASTTQTDPNRTAGLGLTGAATYRWYRLDPQKFFCKRQMWAPNSQAISASDYVMATSGIAAAFAWDMATMVQVLSPWHIQRNKAS